MRVTSDFWVKAYIRQCATQDIPAVVVRRGAEEAGAIYVKVNRLDGTADLFTPAPQAFFDDGDDLDRKFDHLSDLTAEADIDARLQKEHQFDPDIWVVEAEDRQGRHFLQLPGVEKSSPF